MDARTQRDGPPPSRSRPARDDRGESDGGLSRSLGDLLLRTPLFHRILLGNAAVVALGAVAGTAIAVRVGRNWSGAPTLLLAAAFAGAGLLLSVVINGVLVRRLLVPLERLERAAERIQAGADPADEEVASPPTADPGLRRLVRVFNRMLRSLARHRARLREMAVRCLEGAEDERDRISSVLQEDTAQRVASCVVRLRWARTLDGAERDRALDDLRGEMADALDSVRGLARSLRTPELDDIGLESALRALARQVGERWETDVRLALADVDHRLDPDGRLTLYRSVEATLRAWAPDLGPDGAVHVSLEAEDGTVAAVVEVAGTASPALSAENDEPGPTLFALREQARTLGGEMVFPRNAEAPGRVVRVRLPARDPVRPGGSGAGRETGASGTAFAHDSRQT